MSNLVCNPCANGRHAGHLAGDCLAIVPSARGRVFCGCQHYDPAEAIHDATTDAMVAEIWRLRRERDDAQRLVAEMRELFVHMRVVVEAARELRSTLPAGYEWNAWQIALVNALDAYDAALLSQREAARHGG